MQITSLLVLSPAGRFAACESLFVQAQMSPVFVVQAINTAPILLNCDKFGIRGIRGTAAE
jgi:hypothetical protein